MKPHLTLSFNVPWAEWVFPWVFHQAAGVSHGIYGTLHGKLGFKLVCFLVDPILSLI